MEKKNYQFTQVPTNLFILLDNNCRSMLFTLIQLSSYYADEEGWFFRTCSDLEEESNLSQNLVKATLQTLFNHHIIEAKPTGFGKGKKPNYYKVNFEEFSKYDDISIDEAMKNPDLKIRTVDYKGSCFKLNLVREPVTETVTTTVTTTVKSDHNIENIDNIENEENIERDIYKECNTLNEEKEFETACSEGTFVFEWSSELSMLYQYIKEASTMNEIERLKKRLSKQIDTFGYPTEYQELIEGLERQYTSKMFALKQKECYTS